MPSIAGDMHAMVKCHVCFAKDGGTDRGSCWDNLADTIADEGLLASWGPKWAVLEREFAAAWPE